LKSDAKNSPNTESLKESKRGRAALPVDNRPPGDTCNRLVRRRPDRSQEEGPAAQVFRNKTASPRPEEARVSPIAPPNALVPSRF
jgi:hypothetical protein